MFHLLIKAADRAHCIGALERALAPDGRMVLTAFTKDRFMCCSSLHAVRYDASSFSPAWATG